MKCGTSELVNVRLSDNLKSSPTKFEKGKKSSLSLGARKINGNLPKNIVFEENRVSAENDLSPAQSADTFNSGYLQYLSMDYNKIKKNIDIQKEEEKSLELSEYASEVNHSAKESMKKIIQLESMRGFNKRNPKNSLIIDEYDNLNPSSCSLFGSRQEKENHKRRLFIENDLVSLKSEKVTTENEKERFLNELDLFRVTTSKHEGVKKENPPLSLQKEKSRPPMSRGLCLTDEAQRKFGSAKSISSEQFFHDSRRDRLDVDRIQKFRNCSGISSDSYFGHSSDTSADFIDMEQVQESVREGIVKVAGKLSTFASGVLSNF